MRAWGNLTLDTVVWLGGGGVKYISRPLRDIEKRFTVHGGGNFFIGIVQFCPTAHPYV